MSHERPRIGSAIVRAERAVGQPLEAVTHSDAFAQAVSLALTLGGELRRRYRGVTAGVLHRANLPAWSDLVRISRQLASLERRLSDLSVSLERADAAGHPQEPDLHTNGLQASRRSRAR